jgi:hypothetical protein
MVLSKRNEIMTRDRDTCDAYASPAVKWKAIWARVSEWYEW